MDFFSCDDIFSDRNVKKCDRTSQVWLGLPILVHTSGLRVDHHLSATPHVRMEYGRDFSRLDVCPSPTPCRCQKATVRGLGPTQKPCSIAWRYAARLGGFWSPKAREEARRPMDGAALRDYRFVPSGLRSPWSGVRVSRKHSNARRAIIPRFALSPVWTSSRSI